ncbi:hypothetical protein MalM14_05710 [Gimesia chilikensis]|nr:hypothetical protein MalM14_05710 [Gimesia chilikensis]
MHYNANDKNQVVTFEFRVALLARPTVISKSSSQNLSGTVLAAGKLFSAEPTYRWIAPFRSSKRVGTDVIRAERSEQEVAAHQNNVNQRYLLH